MLKRFFGPLILACLFVTCRDNDASGPAAPASMEASLQITYSCYWNDSIFRLQQPYTDDFGTIFRIDLMKQYVSSLQLRKEDDSFVTLKDFDLIDFTAPVSRTFTLPAGKYTGVMMGLGIPENYNTGQDPSQYANSHPLSVAGSQGMFWTWNSGYIFSKFEGKCDTSGIQGNPLLIPIAIHAGTDSAYRHLIHNSEMELVAGQTKNIEIRIHLDELLRGSENSPLNLSEDAVTHSSTDPELARLYMDNLLLSIEIIE
jgi:hypothetical protein